MGYAVSKVSSTMKSKGFSVLLLSVIIVAQSAMIGMVYWTSTVSNDLAKVKSLQLVEQAMQASRSNLSVLTFDYGLWDLAFTLIRDRDEEQVFNDFGVSATDGPHFHEIYILDSTGEPIYAYVRGGDGSDLTTVDSSVSDRLNGKVQNLPVEPYDVISGFDIVNEKMSIVAAGRVQPRDSSELVSIDLPVMVAVRYLDHEMLSATAGSLLLEEGIKLTLADQTDNSGSALLNLIDMEGATIANLTWDAPRPGDEVFRRGLPVALLISLILLGIAIAASSLLQKRAREVIAALKRAETDPLTGLLNRAGLASLIKSERAQAALRDGEMALLYLDLNGFKALNDDAGHVAGDDVLVDVANGLIKSVRSFDSVARLGGDEFVCVLFGKLDHVTIQTMSNRCVTNIKRTISTGSKRHEIDAAVGVAIASSNQDFDKLLNDADSAMYDAKQCGSIQPVFYNNVVKIA